MPIKTTKVDIDLTHPAHQLKFVDQDILTQLVKLPQYLPTEKEPYVSMLKPLRAKFEYSFLYNWLSVFRGSIKMGADAFNVHIWEEELVGLATPPAFLNRLKVMLSNSLLKAGFRSNNAEDFDQNLTLILGEDLPPLLDKYGLDLSDFENEDQDMQFEVEHNEEEPELDENDDEKPKEGKFVQPKLRFFDFLPLEAKIDILYVLVNQVCYTDAFKKFIEKFERPADLRLNPLFSYTPQAKFPIIEHAYFLLDDNRLYLRTLKYNKKVKIPTSGKKLENFDPLTQLEDIDPELEWECLTNNFYEMYDLTQEYKRKAPLKKLGLILSNLLNELAGQELRWKKNYQHRLREKNMQHLLLNRKRSSRLQEKEERKKLEEDERIAEQERLIREGAALRAAKRMKLKQDKEREREERVQRRVENTEGSPAPGAETAVKQDGDQETAIEIIADPVAEQSDSNTSQIKDEPGAEKEEEYIISIDDSPAKAKNEASVNRLENAQPATEESYAFEQSVSDVLAAEQSLSEQFVPKQSISQQPPSEQPDANQSELVSEQKELPENVSEAVTPTENASTNE